MWRLTRTLVQSLSATLERRSGSFVAIAVIAVESAYSAARVLRGDSSFFHEKA